MAIDSRHALASRLAQFLRKNGDQIIHGSCKLSLTTSALCLLNTLFVELLNPDFHTREFADVSIINIHEDLQYLYDFMKRTSSLKLFHGVQTLRGGVDLSHFSNLTVLELRKIPAHFIVGLSSLSDQLKVLICSRSIYLLKELFGTVSDEENPSCIWVELKELNLSYNYLETLDASVRLLPNIEILDLSHNNIHNTDEIQVLKRLNVVNLSYNKLEALPVFSSLSCRFLNKLYVRYNNLETLEGLECLFNLEEIDIGYNLLTEYSALSPLDKLKALKMINLEGNPLFFHKQHLKLVCMFLHSSVLSRGLRVNGNFILTPQKLDVSIGDIDDLNSRHQTSINTVMGDMQHVCPPEINPHLVKKFSPLDSIGSDLSSVEENSASSYTSQKDTDKLIAKATSSKKKKTKKKKSREVVIHNPESVDKIVISTSETNIGEVPSHIKARETLEARRKERGVAWLIPDNSFQQHLPKVPSNTPTFPSGVEGSFQKDDFSLNIQHHIPKVPSNTPIFSTGVVGPSEKDDLPLKIQSCLDSVALENKASTTVEKEMTEVLDIQKHNDLETERKRHISKESDDIEILEPSNFKDSADVVKAENLSDCEFYDSINNDQYDSRWPGDMMDIESDEESEDTIFFTEKVNKLSNQMVLLNIGAKYANEKDAFTGQMIDKLDLSCLSSVSTSTKEKDDTKVYQVHLTFDTVNTSRQARLYVFQDSETAERMSNLLQPFADASTLKEATIGALECINCKSQFSKLVAHRKLIMTKMPFMGKNVMSSSFDSSKEYPQETDACPNCGNHILVELESIPLPTVATPQFIENKVTVPKKSADTTPENASVGSSSSGNFFSSLFTSIKISPMLKRKSAAANESLDSYKSIETIDSEKLLSTAIAAEPPMRRSSSDITIISNPSQSSIAVIPDPESENILNTIVERESQASVSPPLSNSSIVLHSLQDIEDSATSGYETETLVKTSIPHALNDQDFYSLTESTGDETEKPSKSSDIISHDSDVFHSPPRSMGSTNTETSNDEVDESVKLMQHLASKKIASHDNFLQLDHRLKLHIEINIFGKDEHLTACLQTSIVPLYLGEEFDGVFALSSKNVFIIKFLPLYSQTLERSESLVKQLQILFSGPSSQIKQVKSLMGNQGLTIACGPAAHIYTLVIRDADTCNSLLNLISEQILEKNSQFEVLRDTAQTHSMLEETVLLPFTQSEQKPEVLLYQFAFHKDKDILSPVCIILTLDNIYLSRILYKKQSSCSNLSDLLVYCYANTEQQNVSDIVSLKLMKDMTIVEICFLIESSAVDSLSWTIEMQTKSAMYSFISALKSPWEELFHVPLPLTMAEANS